MNLNIDRPTVPPLHALRLREAGFVVHHVAVFRATHATAVVRRHVGPDGDVSFTGHVDSDTSPQWIDDTTQAADAADAWAFVVRELDAARAEHQKAVAAANERHPAGSALGGAR
ncbi:hypothetical protein [Mycobacterium avium]|uniref:hypothetical protein n=1 Tax=Mycobacterium avium TaxID=1764 RepID=UPI001CC821FB|nr:hypothetical protein [Mycobacterium avium]MBZ4618838.1 hypothetical protein [Mycobacterium avium subsp. hominissuis]